jgi:hypothetical protein
MAGRRYGLVNRALRSRELIRIRRGPYLLASRYRTQLQRRLARYNAANAIEQTQALEEILQEVALYALWRGEFFNVAAFRVEQVFAVFAIRFAAVWPELRSTRQKPYGSQRSRSDLERQLNQPTEREFTPSPLKNK